MGPRELSRASRPPGRTSTGLRINGASTPPSGSAAALPADAHGARADVDARPCERNERWDAGLSRASLTPPDCRRPAVNRAAVQAAAKSRESRGQPACHTRRAWPPRYWRSWAYEARTVPLSSSFHTQSHSWIRVPQCAQTGYGWLITSPDCRAGGRDRWGAFLPYDQTSLGHRRAGMASEAMPDGRLRVAHRRRRGLRCEYRAGWFARCDGRWAACGRGSVSSLMVVAPGPAVASRVGASRQVVVPGRYVGLDHTRRGLADWKRAQDTTRYVVREPGCRDGQIASA